MRTHSPQISEVFPALCPREYVIHIKERVCSEVTGRVDDTQRTVITTSADPLLTCCDLHALRRRDFDARREALLAKEGVRLLEFLLQMGDDSMQLVDRVT